MSTDRKSNPTGVSRRELLTGCAAAGLAAASVGSAEQTTEAPLRELPNIIWLIADDVGWKDLGCYGHPTVRTPNLDRLAIQGLRFSNAFGATPTCSPSRATMFTGKYAHAVGAEDLHDPLPAGIPILPSFLKQRGYFTANVGKLHLGPHAAKQFDRVEKSVGAWTTVLDQRPKGKPFFLAVGFHDAHRPFDRNALADPHDPADAIVPPYLPDTPEVREELAAYYDEISRMDDEIGKLLWRLDEDGLTANTMVIFLSDNGAAFPRCKTNVYDSGVGTPLIVRWPGHAPAGVTNDGLASLVDLTPTMLRAAGIPIPWDMQGRNLLPMFLDARAKSRDYVFAERNWHDYDDHLRAVRTERFHYLRNYYPDEPFGHPLDIVRSKTYQKMRELRDAGTLTPEQALTFRVPRPREELYDVAADPDEFRNLADDPEHAETLAEMRRLLDRWIKKTGDVPPSKRKPNIVDLETGERLP